MASVGDISTPSAGGVYLPLGDKSEYATTKGIDLSNLYYDWDLVMVFPYKTGKKEHTLQVLFEFEYALLSFSIFCFAFCVCVCVCVCVIQKLVS